MKAVAEEKFADDEAEHCVIGALLNYRGEDLDLIEETTSAVSVDDFFYDKNRAIAGAIFDFIGQGQDYSIPMVVSALPPEHRVEHVWLGSVAASGIAQTGPYYAKKVADLAARRRVVEQVKAFAKKIGDTKAPLDEVLAHHVEAVAGIAKKATPKRIVYKSGTDLSQLEAHEMKWLIPKLLPEVGLVILGGKPKMGKSWFAIDVANAVANGGPALGCPDLTARKGTALYLALEDSDSRLKGRMKRLQCPFVDAFQCVTAATGFPAMSLGGEAELNRFLDDHRDTKLVIVDTLEKLRGARSANENLYASDYSFTAKFQKLALDRELCVLVLHHQRKMKSEDVFDTFSGSLGISSAADMLLILSHVEGARGVVNLHARGRDSEDMKYALKRLEGGVLQFVGEDVEDEMPITEQQAEIVALLTDHGPMTIKQLASATGKRYDAIRTMASRMFKAGALDRGDGKYHIPTSDDDEASQPERKDVF